MRVGLVVRRDAKWKPGGDLEQARRYNELLSQAGASVVEIDRIRDVRHASVDLFHVFNTDRPYELKTAHDAVGSRPFVLSPIHHNRKHVRSFYEHRSGVLGVAERRLPYSCVEYLKHHARYKGTPGEWHLSPVRDDTTRLILRRAASIVLLSRSEQQWVECDYGISLDNATIVPNGAPEPKGARADGRDVDIIVVGRIEPRKNQLALARTLGGTPFVVEFAGSPNEENTGYVNLFRQVVMASPNLSWVGRVPPAEMASHYARAKISVSASFFEVQSLVDLEAAACGCMVIASSAGSSAEVFGRQALYINPAEVDTLPDLITMLLTRPRYADPVSLPSWKQTANRLVEIYEKAICP